MFNGAQVIKKDICMHLHPSAYHSYYQRHWKVVTHIIEISVSNFESLCVTIGLYFCLTFACLCLVFWNIIV